jgi:hypothetical protein
VATQSVIHSVEQSKSVLSFPIPAPEPVTQLELTALLSLRNRARQLAEQIEDAESSIEARATVETGEHTAELKESSRRSVAWRVVAERLADHLFGKGKGDGYCERVLRATRPTRTVNLVIQQIRNARRES